MRIPILTIMITINIFKKTIRFDVTCSSDGGGNINRSLEGTVYYNNSNSRIFGADVYLDGDLRAETDKYGEFYISGLNKNSYNLRIKKDGFHDYYEDSLLISEIDDVIVYLVPEDDRTIVSGQISIYNSTGFEGESLNNKLGNFTSLSNITKNRADDEYIENEVIVKYSDSDQVSSLSNSNQVQGLSVSKSMNLGRGELVKYKTPVDKSVEEIIEYFEKQPGVEFAEPNYIAHALAQPNDTEYGLQWGLVSANMEAAWDQQEDSINVSVAVIDSGVIPNHDDLDNNLFNGANFVGGSEEGDPYNFEGTDDPTDKTPKSENGSHGTHVAGVIGALTNNSNGVAGMSWGINIIPVRVLDSDQTGNIYDIAEGIYYAAGSEDIGGVNADILNLSLGTPSASDTLKEAIEFAHNRDKVIIAATGNDGNSSLLYPAKYPEVIAVGAVDKTNKRTDYSNYGSDIDLVAPGGDLNIDNGILSTWGYYEDGTVYTDEYAYMEGTSMAAAHVSGAAALLIQSGVNPVNVENRLKSTAVDLGSSGYDYEYGSGLIDVYGALLNQRLENPYIFAASKSDSTTIRIESDFSQMEDNGEYTLKDDIVGSYYMAVWRDVNDNNNIDAGDYFGITDSRTYFEMESYYTIDIDMYYVTSSSTAAALSVEGIEKLRD
ncbi:MAG: peptidase S8/S53 subtilisin kexin sedolisin [Halanaerobium sp.]|nr:MAG: peptidase S8/S53 subtilisin kexin sedolisin [Halanaerobium sp.]